MIKDQEVLKCNVCILHFTSLHHEVVTTTIYSISLREGMGVVYIVSEMAYRKKGRKRGRDCYVDELGGHLTPPTTT